MGAEERLIELGIVLQEYPKTVGKYVQAVLVGDCYTLRATDRQGSMAFP